MQRTAPDFWWRQRIGLKALALAPVAFVYGRIARARMLKSSRDRVEVPVIVVGNFVAGGAGKTPTTIALARLLRNEGRAPFILTRGYGGNLEGPVRADPDTHGAREIGDEALLLAEAAPTIVSADRGAGARAAIAEGADIILMDDGFQNPALFRDFAFVVAEGAVGVGNGMTIPAGPLRVPLRDQMVKANALIVIGPGEGGARLVRQAARRGLTVLRADLKPRPNPDVSGRRVLAFAGIGRPQKFFDTLEETGAEIVERRTFPDHHVLTRQEVQEILTTAEEKSLVAVTTAKDMRRLEGDDQELMRWLAGSARVIEVDLVFRDEGRVMELLRRVIRDHPFR
ncbi:lipid-A-disaccharide kinase [Breoghania corrubedonensis]|uniref:Tetraacyldisaccharide 4'-kinase n=1 Tax=Breoghania corrubedonensis TaxID=665038 RepID=A0A2T5VET7_9HYPH|nr:tetraacyldisaccharide 4'-kinase [Breoghania corrubedonensis]PTW62272.1 lipid-A-disaccharide kinase [Breoghania corrubedonensis]